jgi:hypothetical protein
VNGRGQSSFDSSENTASGMVAATALLLLVLILVVLASNGAFQPQDAIGVGFVGR